ncbi:MAG: FkbM family methyltransferase [Pseudomonadota bacterium]
MNADLIYDVGMHKGEDTEFYLRKGFRVVAIEANPELAAACATRFKEPVEKGRLTIVNKAINDAPGAIDFYINENESVWSTANLHWAKRNEKRGTTNTVIKVDAVTIASVIEAHGEPYFMKVDIEGNDIFCLTGLRSLGEKPKFISVESSATSEKDTMEQLDVLAELGYTRFKIVSQHDVARQTCPNPPREGLFVDHSFTWGASGLFGEETPGPWKSLDQVRSEYRRIHFDCRMAGQNAGIFRKVNRWKMRRLLGRMFPRSKGWFDTHATY